MTKLDHALKLAAEGFYVFPIVEDGKCRFCSETVPENRGFCDTECRDGWELEQRRREGA